MVVYHFKYRTIPRHIIYIYIYIYEGISELLGNLEDFQLVKVSNIHFIAVTTLKQISNVSYVFLCSVT